MAMICQDAFMSLRVLDAKVKSTALRDTKVSDHDGVEQKDPESHLAVIELGSTVLFIESA